MNAESLKLIPWRSIKETLHNIKRSRFPPARKCNELINVMSNNAEVRNELGMFRGEVLYRFSFLDEFGNVSFSNLS